MGTKLRQHSMSSVRKLQEVFNLHVYFPEKSRSKNMEWDGLFTISINLEKYYDASIYFLDQDFTALTTFNIE
jgi:hypothetical protein